MGAGVSELFFTMNPNLKYFFWGGGGGGAGGAGGRGDRVFDFFFKESKS